ncbi:LCP family protein [Rhodococcus sp. X156]|uniref:LCP family protein n=1 Tax=Rhodococcus sp. X156 TaxID=2499145 RepID=UPI001F496E14|nr:LCP family protein [Rhodococcus sp. X156]
MPPQPGAGARSDQQYPPTRVGRPYADQPYRDQPPAQPRSGEPPQRPADPRRVGAAPPRPRRRRPRWGRRIGVVALVLVLLFVGFFFYLDSSLKRTEALEDYPGRVADTPGTNWLLVGSDSRVGLTPDQEQALNTGSESDAGGSRTDTIMLLHIPEGSDSPTLVSIPRDSELTIPGHGRDKVNAAFAIGGAPLLAQTVEVATKVRIDHYAEIGFGGFANLVDAVGGVNMCIDPPGMNDPFSGARFEPGCQDLTGAQALAYVRNRHDYPDADVTRVAHQREFLSALMGKASSVGTLLNPFRVFPLVTNGVSSFTVDDGDHLWHLAAMGWAMRGGMVTTTVPFDGGSRWTSDAPRFWAAIAADEPVPSELLTKPR